MSESYVDRLAAALDKVARDVHRAQHSDDVPAEECEEDTCREANLALAAYSRTREAAS